MSLESISFASTLWAIGAAVLQFLWQGALIGIVTALALAALRRSSPDLRHAVGFGALFVCLLSFCVSFLRALSDVAQASSGAALLRVPFTAEGTLGLPVDPTSTRVAAWCWVLGVGVMSLRLGLQNLAVHRLRTRDVRAPEPRWQPIFDRLQRELGLKRGVRLLRSGLADVPMVVGWLSPVVLVPASAFSGLPPDQLRALLAHELAHVRRHDHLLNGLQAIVESVLFFHPVVWWISKQVRAEREYCCDDASIQVSGDPKVLAQALASMASLRLDHVRHKPALAATGGPLMQRITRILGIRHDAPSSLASWQLPASLVFAGVLALTGSAYASSSQETRGEVVRVEDKVQAISKEYERIKADYAKVQAQLDAAVAAGKLTEEQAKEKLIALEKRLVELERRTVVRGELLTDAARAHEKLEAAVRAGKITRVEADRRLAAMEQELAERQQVRDQSKRVWAELEAGVAAGKLTKAQAKERYAAWQAGRDKDALMRAEYAMVKADVVAAVKAGRLTEEQAKAKLLELEKSMTVVGRRLEKFDAEAVIKKVQAAVEAGKLTPAEGKAKILELRKAMQEKTVVGRLRTNEAYEEMKQAVTTAVKNGSLTAEEGQRKLDAYARELDRRAAKRLVEERRGR